MFDVVGTVAMQNAYVYGPAGPISAILVSSAIILMIYQAIATKKMLTEVELLGAVVGTYGVLVIVIPEFFERICCCCCRSKRYKSESNL